MIFPQHKHGVGVIFKTRQKRQWCTSGIYRHRRRARGINSNAFYTSSYCGAGFLQAFFNGMLKSFYIVQRVLAKLVERGIAKQAVSPPGIIKNGIRLAHEGGKALGFASPRIAVAGLNPHAGEGGLFGDEEITIIRPAIDAARAEGIDATGPYPGDTVFMQARQGRFDVVVAQYHDQGLIPVKYLGLEKGVNITLGLPFVRTSPDHGTAFDIAGVGIADHASLQTALTYAKRLVASQTKTN